MSRFSLGNYVRVKLDHHDPDFRGERGRIRFFDVWKDVRTAVVAFDGGITKEFYLDQIEHAEPTGEKEQELPTKQKPEARDVNRLQQDHERAQSAKKHSAKETSLLRAAGTRNRPITAALMCVDTQITELEELIEKLSNGLSEFLSSPLEGSADKVSDGYIVDQNEPPLAKDIRQRASRLAGLRRELESILSRLDP